MSSWRWTGLAAALLPMLGGCVAMALPVVAGGAMIAGGGKHEPRRAPPKPGHAVARTAPSPAPGPAFRVTGLSQLPPPSGAPAGPDRPPAGDGSPWSAFARYAVARAAEPDEGSKASVLLESAPLLGDARFSACGYAPPAVIVDLDPHDRLFAADRAAPAAAEVRADLQRLRDAGITVLWLSEKPAEQAESIAAALKLSGLDPAGSDFLVLARSPAERKQVLRARAGLARCVVAIAGDADSDFDEFFDYLRDPDSAAAYHAKLGAGWFIVPPPLG